MNGLETLDGMDIENFRNFCLSLPGSTEKMPFEKFFRGRHSFLAFYVSGRMFCYFDIDKFDRCNIRCEPEQIGQLEAAHDDVGKPYNLNPKHWISVAFNGDVTDAELIWLVRRSYDIALNQCTVRKKAGKKSDKRRE